MPESLIPPEKFGALTDDQARKLQEFRGIVSHEVQASPQHPEVVGQPRMLRYLRAFRYDVEEASGRYIEFLRWRRESGVEKVREDIVTKKMTPEDFPNADKVAKHWQQKLYWAQDKLGNPIVYDCIGKLSVSNLLAEFNGDDKPLLEYHLYVMEHKQLLLDKLSRERGQLVFCYEIKDLKGIGFSILSARTLLSQMSKLTSDYYVETTWKVGIINLPMGFGTFYSMAEPFIPDRTKAKINIVKYASENQKQLGDDIPTSNIDPASPQFDRRPANQEETAAEDDSSAAPPMTPRGGYLTPREGSGEAWKEASAAAMELEVFGTSNGARAASNGSFDDRNRLAGISASYEKQHEDSSSYRHRRAMKDKTSSCCAACQIS